MKADIKRRGLREKVHLTPAGKLAEGRNRYRALRGAGTSRGRGHRGVNARRGNGGDLSRKA